MMLVEQLQKLRFIALSSRLDQANGVSEQYYGEEQKGIA
jgi:hypothetical protein